MKLRKKCLAILLTLVLTASMASVAMAKDLYSGFCGDRATWGLDFNGTLTIKGNGDMNAYAIGSHADFRQYSSKIKKVIVQKNILSVGAYAFQGMTALSSAKLEDSVIRIGTSAFSGCTALTAVTLSSILSSIGSYAFSDCTSLKSIVIPASVSSLGAHSFDGCTGLQTIEVQNASCRLASSDILPQGVTVVGYKGSTAQTYAEKNGLAFKEINTSSAEPTTQPATQPTSGTTTTTDAGKCPLCGQTHEGFPGSLIGGVHSFIYWLLMLFGMRS